MKPVFTIKHYSILFPSYRSISLHYIISFILIFFPILCTFLLYFPSSFPRSIVSLFHFPSFNCSTIPFFAFYPSYIWYFLFLSYFPHFLLLPLVLGRRQVWWRQAAAQWTPAHLPINHQALVTCPSSLPLYFPLPLFRFSSPLSLISFPLLPYP